MNGCVCLFVCAPGCTNHIFRYLLSYICTYIYMCKIFNTFMLIYLIIIVTCIIKFYITIYIGSSSAHINRTWFISGRIMLMSLVLSFRKSTTFFILLIVDNILYRKLKFRNSKIIDLQKHFIKIPDVSSALSYNSLKL